MLSVVTTIETGKREGVNKIQHFIDEITIDGDGFLQCKPFDHYGNLYDPCEDDGHVPAPQDKWRESEAIARLVCQHSEEVGIIVHHSDEGDGAAVGWEFDGISNMRKRMVCAIGNW